MAELRTNIPDQSEGETSADFVYPEAKISTWNPYASGALALEIAAAMEAALPAKIQAETDPSMRPDPETNGRYHAETSTDTAPYSEIEIKPVDPLVALGQIGTKITYIRESHRNDFDLAA